MKARALRIAVVVGLVLGLAYLFRDPLLRAVVFRRADPPQQQKGRSLADVPPDAVTVVARDLETPWDLEFLGNGDLLVTERPGRLVRIGADGRRSYAIEGVREYGEGGLMGLALHPEFATNGWIYVYFTATVGGATENRVERYRLTREGLDDRTVILAGIPAAPFHDGGRIEFGPDGLLYVSTGDAGSSGRAQDRRSLAGKILRVTDDGGPAADNPFGTTVYSFGHRNPQGLAWDAEGRFWATEHGRSGLRSGMDELNRIEKGSNYGWPEIEGDAAAPGMELPITHSGPDYTWAPSGLAYRDGALFFGGLRGEALYEARIAGDGVAELRAHFVGEFGRIRDVRIGPDDRLYFTTSNRDGRGRVREGDDRIVRVDPTIFEGVR